MLNNGLTMDSLRSTKQISGPPAHHAVPFPKDLAPAGEDGECQVLGYTGAQRMCENIKFYNHIVDTNIDDT